MSTISQRKSLYVGVPKNEKTTKNRIGVQLLVVISSMAHKGRISLNEANHFLFEVIIYLSVSSEGAATFLVSAQRTYKIRILNFLV